MTGTAVLAYSGGLDTSCAIAWLKEDYGFDEVIAVLVDVGQGGDVDESIVRGKAAGADDVIVADKTIAFATDQVAKAIATNALYEGKYPLVSALSRPVIAEAVASLALELGAEAVVHGCTGKGNDQLRFELAFKAHYPGVKVIAPLRDRIWTRDEEIEYALAKGIPVVQTAASPFSIDENLFGRAIEAGVLEDPWAGPPEEPYALTSNPSSAPTSVEIVVGFEQGVPVSLDGEDLSLAALIAQTNELAGAYGIGRIDMVENRAVGIKSREVYEAPGAMTLIAAHSALEDVVLTKDEARLKRPLEQRWTELVYEGLWFSPAREAIDAFVDTTQQLVSGDVRVEREGRAVRAEQLPVRDPGLVPGLPLRVGPIGLERRRGHDGHRPRRAQRRPVELRDLSDARRAAGGERDEARVDGRRTNRRVVRVDVRAPHGADRPVRRARVAVARADLATVGLPAGVPVRGNRRPRAFHRRRPGPARDGRRRYPTVRGRLRRGGSGADPHEPRLGLRTFEADLDEEHLSGPERAGIPRVEVERHVVPERRPTPLACRARQPLHDLLVVCQSQLLRADANPLTGLPVADRVDDTLDAGDGAGRREGAQPPGERIGHLQVREVQARVAAADQAFEAAMRDDLNTAAALAGIAFASMLMLMQLGFRDALLDSAVLVNNALQGDLVSDFEYISRANIWINGGFFIFRRNIFGYLHDGEELVEQPFQRSATGLHATCHFTLGYLIAFHFLRDLIDYHALDCGGLHLLEEILLFEEIVKFASNVVLVHGLILHCII